MPRTLLSADPKLAGRKPPYTARKQRPPGRESKMAPKADHGQDSYVGKSRLARKVAIITGADSGIGRAIAIAFAREGVDVVLSYLRVEERDVRETANWVIKAGREALLVPGDVRQKRYCKSLVSRAMKKFGQLDILVNNAAFQRTYAKPADISEREFDQTFRTNVYGTFFLSQAALEEMGKGGSIINTSPREWPKRQPNEASESTEWRLVPYGRRSSHRQCRDLSTRPLAGIRLSKGRHSRQ